MRFNGNLKWFWDYKTENTEKCRILMREPTRREKWWREKEKNAEKEKKNKRKERWEKEKE